MKPVLAGVLFFFLSLGHPGAHGQPSSPPEAGEALYDAGRRLYDAGKYQTAADTLARAVQLFESSNNLEGKVKSQLLLGECYANAGRCDDALQVLQSTLKLSVASFSDTAPEVGESYYYLARATGGCARKWEEAIRLMHKSIALRRKVHGAGSPEIALNFNFLGYMLNNTGQHDSAIAYLDQALAIRKRLMPEAGIETSHILFNLATAYDRKSQPGKALTLHLEALGIRRAHLGEDHATVSNSITSIGAVYQKFGNYDRALDYYQKGLDIRIRTLGPEHSNVAASYYTIGNLYGAMFNYHQSLQYFQQGNRILEKNYGGVNDILATYLAYTGRLYGKLGDHATAIAYLKKAEAMAEKVLDTHHPYLAIVYNISGDYYADHDDDPAKAVAYLEKAIAIYKVAYGVGSVREADAYSKLGARYAAINAFPQAMKYYYQALGIYDSKIGPRNPKSAGIHHAMGNALTAQQRFADGLEEYRKAFSAISSPATNLADPYVNPAAENLENKFVALKIASSKAGALARMAANPGSGTATLVEAMDTYEFAMSLIEDIAAGYNNDNGRTELEKESRAVYSSSLNTAHRLYTLTRDMTYAHKAFAICAKSKSAILLESMKDDHARMLAGVPDSLVSKERDLKIELAYHRNNLYQAQVAGDTGMAVVHEKNAFDAEEKVRKLKDELKGNFPSYYRMKYNRDAASVEEVQQFIKDPGTAVVEYFVADSAIYRFTITRESFAISAIEKNTRLADLLRDYDRSLTDAAFIMNQRDTADHLYTMSAFGLYELLLKDVIDSHDGITKLIIVPDDFLSQMNFTTLLCRKADSRNADYTGLDFLGRRCQISYLYSTFFMKDHNIRRANFSDLFAGFAPSYSGSQYAAMDSAVHPMAYVAVRDGTLPLPGAQEEVRRVSGLMGGRTWMDLEATETNFKEHAGDFGILHLAMHSLINNENPVYSELLFNREADQVNDGFLSIAEIYNLKLNANLVVLSACSSGYGRIQKGEGPITISRAFAYAGCPSVVMSLWKIPDAVTAEIMTNFYEELRQGKDKDEALRQAQLRFLNETQDPLHQHPYFWAGFVVMGDTAPIPSGALTWIYFVLSGLILLALVLFLKRRKARSV